MTIRNLLEAKAHALAEEMATSPTVLHLQAAAHHLTVELRRELDALIADFRPAGLEVKREDPAPAELAADPAQVPVAAEPAQICAGDDGCAPAAEEPVAAGDEAAPAPDAAAAAAEVAS